jgi:hypothetical protein
MINFTACTFHLILWYVSRVFKLKWVGEHVALTGKREMRKNIPVDWRTSWESTYLRYLAISKGLILKWAWGSGIRSRYSDWLRAGLSRGRSSIPIRVKKFLVSTSSRPVLGPTHPPIQWVPGVKQPVRETDHSPPTFIEVRKTWIYTSTPPYSFMA